MLDCDLVIFDCDGVLIDSEVLSCSCLAEIFAMHGIAMSLDEVIERFLGRGFAAVPAYFRESTGRTLPESFARDLKARQSELFTASLLPMPHVMDVLASLDRPYCLASSSDPDRIRISLAVTRLDRFFEGRIFSAAMVTRAKPAPGSVSACGRDHGRRAGACARHRGQRQRRVGGQGSRHGDMGLHRRQPPCRARYGTVAEGCRRRARVSLDGRLRAGRRGESG